MRNKYKTVCNVTNHAKLYAIVFCLIIKHVFFAYISYKSCITSKLKFNDNKEKKEKDNRRKECKSFKHLPSNTCAIATY